MQTDEEIGKVAAAVPVIICILPAKYPQSFKAPIICMRGLNVESGVRFI